MNYVEHFQIHLHCIYLYRFNNYIIATVIIVSFKLSSIPGLENITVSTSAAVESSTQQKAGTSKSTEEDKKETKNKENVNTVRQFKLFMAMKKTS